MEFYSNIGLTRQYGVDEATFFHCMASWVVKNRANGQYHREGCYRTHNTLGALSKLFPFWLCRRLERVINGLEEVGTSLAGNSSEDRTDCTRWYALANCILEVYEGGEPSTSRNGEMHFTSRGQPLHGTVKCNKEAVTYQIDPPKPPKGGRRGSAELDGAVKSLLAEYTVGDTELAEALDALMEIRAAEKAVDSTRVVTTLLNRLNRLSDNLQEVKLQILEQSMTNSREDIFPLKDGQAQTRKEPKRYVE